MLQFAYVTIVYETTNGESHHHTDFCSNCITDFRALVSITHIFFCLLLKSLFMPKLKGHQCLYFFLV